MPLTKPPITLGADVWVCADVFVGPGVTVGDGAILGARAVVVRDVASRAIVAGNPACLVGMRDI
jgi:putative colanic acid biosynthesis acetyltransferase WcaF